MTALCTIQKLIRYIDQYIRDPKAANRDATMPGFKGPLTEQQIEDLARYLSSSQRMP